MYWRRVERTLLKTPVSDQTCDRAISKEDCRSWDWAESEIPVAMPCLFKEKTGVFLSTCKAIFVRFVSNEQECLAEAE